MNSLDRPLLLLGSVLLLAGCGATDNAGFSPDEDALPARTGASLVTSGPTYGATSYQTLSLPSSHVQPPEEPADTSSDFDNLEIVSPSLKGQLAVTRVGSDRTDGNLLSVFAGLKNKSGHPLQLEVQTLYMDKTDHSLTDGRKSWIPITLKPHEATQYRSVAISEDATDFVVRIRHAQSNTTP
jgi:hypothetical protein